MFMHQFLFRVASFMPEQENESGEHEYGEEGDADSYADFHPF